MNDEEIQEMSVSGHKDYIISILEEMNEEELDIFDNRFRLIDKRDELSKIILNMDEQDDEVIDKLSKIYSYVRDAYWSGE